MAALVAEVLAEIFDQLFHEFPIATRAGRSQCDGLVVQRSSGQSFVSFDIFCLGLGDHVRGKGRRGWRLVPVAGFQEVADELLVKAWLAATGLVLVGGPEAR